MPTNTGDLIDRGDAQALMPEEVSRAILQAVITRSAALTLFPRVNMGRTQRRLPVLTQFPIAYWVGGDVGLKSTSKALWGNRYLDAAEVAVIVPIPQAVFDDSDYDMWAEIQPRIAEAIGVKLDGAVFFGTDVPSEWSHAPNGIVDDAVTAGNEVTLGDALDFGLDLSAAMELVEDSGFDVTGFAGSRKLRAKLRNIRSTGSGEPIYQSIAGPAPDTIFAEPYGVASNGAWDGTELAVTGDFSQGILGVRQDISYTVHNEGVISDDEGAIVLNLMQQDALALRAVARFAFVVSNTITQQKTDDSDATRYPFAVVHNSGS